MFYSESEKYVIVPLASNIFFQESKLNRKYMGFAKEYFISDKLFDEIKELIRQFVDVKVIALDMNRVDYPGRLFEELVECTEMVIFFNVNRQVLKDKLKENLPHMKWNEEDTLGVHNGNVTQDIILANDTCFKNVNKVIYKDILNSIVDLYDRDPIYLDSSGLYGNMYISAKKLFVKPEAYFQILYGMALETEKLGEFDSFISSSKNGAVLAEILGAMLGKKVVHIRGVGPRYSMYFGNIQKEIKKGKSYVYVFDFVCTGTELKILSALVNANDAYLIGGVGIAEYEGEMEEKNSFMEKINPLITTKEAGLNYKIAGCREDVRKLS